MKKALVLFIVLSMCICAAGCRRTHEAISDTPLLERSFPLEPSENAETSLVEEEAWVGISIDGIDESSFTKDMRLDLLQEIAAAFQSLTAEIAEKERADPQYVLRGAWYGDVIGSAQYHQVIDMGSAAMKPLYFIIYRSEHQGLYEYICCMALSELYGDTQQREDGTQGWATAKEFLEVITKEICDDTQE